MGSALDSHVGEVHKTLYRRVQCSELTFQASGLTLIGFPKQRGQALMLNLQCLLSVSSSVFLQFLSDSVIYFGGLKKKMDVGVRDVGKGRGKGKGKQKAVTLHL